jgi:hypothetical protein
MSILSTEQRNELNAILIRLFPLRVQFDQMLVNRAGQISLDAIAATNALETDIFYVVRDAESKGWTRKLINAAREARPNDAQLLAFAQLFQMAATSIRGMELQRIINAGNNFLDVATWRSQLGIAETRVCRIEVPLTNGGTSYGTGFLVGPSVVMTNYHVIEPILKQKADPEKVVVRFDYKRLEDGQTLNPGTTHSLTDEKWLIGSSPYSEADKASAPPGSLPSKTELDFALLRVKGRPGEEPVGAVMTDGAPKRGYFDLSVPAIEIEAGDPILILQHPEGDYLKLAIDMDAGLETNANGTRLRYTTNTLKGSSGSPCFNANWKLVALHHAGDPNYSSLHKAEYNQGVPIGMIWKHIQQSNGLETALKQ